MLFRIKTVGQNGAIDALQLDARDSADALRLAEALGHTVIAAKPAGFFAGLSARRQRFPLGMFSQELLSLVQSGLSVVEGMEVLAEKERSGSVRAVIEGILRGLREGRTLSKALEELPHVFPMLYVASIRASEKTGDLPEALQRFIAYQSQVDELRSRLVNASIYPAILLGVGGLVIVFLLAFVVPRFSRIYEDLHGDLPWLSQVLLEWGRFAEKYGAQLGLATVGLILFAIHLLRRDDVRARIGGALWRIPAIGERMRIFHIARCYRTAGMLLRGGIPLVTALDMVMDLLAPVLRPRLAAAATRIREGIPASRALEEQGLTTPVAQRLLRVGERTGNMGEMLERTAVFHDEEISRWVETASRLFGPVLMLVVGMMIGGIVVLLYLPIFQVAESIG